MTGSLGIARSAALLAVAMTCACPVGSGTPTAPPPLRLVRVAAAISLRQPLASAVSPLRALGIALEPIYGGSGDLARQVEAGSPIDLFASAALAQAEALEAKGLAQRSCLLAHNRLVLVRAASPALSGLSWETLASSAALKHLAIGAAKLVPAGDYAEAALRKLGSWEALQPKLVRAGNVRQVVELVARGEAEAGVVYATDLADGPALVVVGEPPASAAVDVRYPLDVIAGPDGGGAAVALARDYLCGPEFRARLLAAGFQAP